MAHRHSIWIAAVMVLTAGSFALGQVGPGMFLDFGTGTDKFQGPGEGYNYNFGSGTTNRSITYAEDHVQIEMEFNNDFNTAGFGWGSGQWASGFAPNYFGLSFDPDTSLHFAVEARILAPPTGTEYLDFFKIQLTLVSPEQEPDTPGEQRFKSTFDIIPSTVQATPGDIPFGDGVDFAAVVLEADLANPDSVAGYGAFKFGEDTLDQIQIFVQNGFRPEPDADSPNPGNPNPPAEPEPTPQLLQIQIDNISLVDTSALLAGDANGDGQVDGNDLISVEENFGATGDPGIPGDANGDGQVDGNDLISVEENFGSTSGASSVPEPASMLLLGLCGAALLRTRR